MNETAALEDVILSEARRTIAAVAEEEAQQIQALNDAHQAEMADFEKKLRDQTEVRIRQEASRAENRAALDLKKFKLKRFEAFVSRSIMEAVLEIRTDPRYRHFLKEVMTDALARVSGGAAIRLAGEDRALSDEILHPLGKITHGRDISIAEDPSIKWGGCIVVEKDGSRIFDSTLERICFRKSRAIRLEVMRLLDAAGAKAR